MRKDQTGQQSHSQSQATNLQTAQASVADLLKGKGADVYTIAPDATLHTTVELLRDKHIGALVVADEAGALVGILSERDIVRKLADTPGQTLPQLVRDVMTSKVETCTPDEPLLSVLKRMTEGRFRHMPVVDGGALAGMVTIGDVINHRLNELEHEALQLKQLIVG
jgi:CBS domain-containing protein